MEGHVDSNISITRNNMQDKSINQNKQNSIWSRTFVFSSITSISLTFKAIHKAPLYCSFSFFHKLNVKSGILYRIYNR